MKIISCFLFAGDVIHKVVISGDISSSNSKMVAKWKISSKDNFAVSSIVYSVSNNESFIH